MRVLDSLALGRLNATCRKTFVLAAANTQEWQWQLSVCNVVKRTPEEEAHKSKVLKEEGPKKETQKEEVPKSEAHKEEAPNKDAPKPPQEDSAKAVLAALAKFGFVANLRHL